MKSEGKIANKIDKQEKRVYIPKSIRLLFAGIVSLNL